MQSASSRNIDQHCYWRNQPVYASLDKAYNSNDSKTEESKLKAQESKALNLNSNNSLRPDLRGNAETFDKV